MSSSALIYLYLYVNIRSDHGLVPSRNKSLLEPKLTKFRDAVWRH